MINMTLTQLENKNSFVFERYINLNLRYINLKHSLKYEKSSYHFNKYKFVLVQFFIDIKS